MDWSELLLLLTTRRISLVMTLIPPFGSRQSFRDLLRDNVAVYMPSSTMSAAFNSAARSQA
jgi:hypothetical protein